MITINLLGFILLLISVLFLGGAIGALIMLRVLEKDVNRTLAAFEYAAESFVTVSDQTVELIDWVGDIPSPYTEEAMEEHMKRFYTMMNRFCTELVEWQEEYADDQD